ncbi:DNA repair protein XRCC4-like [Vanessa cardui]|uniref:DNA repair protein XRCC4-like n=1 Tax=Vanessa cardui TaxID=171605 RepID=UPI001F144392|nr:DNA repair protein XRCC4-like [Vanessa cardui]
MDCRVVPETFVTKFEVNQHILYAKIFWAKSESVLFDIQVFRDDHIWSGCFSFELAKTFEERLHENAVEYAKNVMDALKLKSNMYKYEFTLSESNACEAKFCWKRLFAESSAVLVHGFVTLQQDKSTETKDSIIDYLLNENKLLQNTIEGLKKNNEQLNNEVENFKSEFEKLIDIKESLESNLYGKFIQLLNTKKRRIKLLENHIAKIEGESNI